MSLLVTARRTLALIPAVIAGAMPLAAQDSAAPGWISIRLNEGPGEEPGEPLLRRARPIGALGPWVSAADFPANISAGKRSGYVTLRLSIDANDQIIACASESGPGLAPQLAAWACERVRQHGRFLHALAADGRPIADVVTLRMTFNNAADPLPIIPPAPPAPPLPTGPRPYRPNLKLVDVPEASLRARPGLNGTVVVQVYRWQRYGGTLSEPICSVERSSGDAEIDKTSCAAAAKASYAFLTPSWTSGSMQMRFRWRNGQAKIEAPERDQTTPLELRFEPPLTRTGLSFSDTGYFTLTFRPGSKVDCRVMNSTGNDALDLATCRDIVAHARFKPEINLFGEQVPTSAVYRLAPDTGTLDRVR